MKVYIYLIYSEHFKIVKFLISILKKIKELIKKHENTFIVLSIML